jgi:hypothetical protein
LKFEIKYDKQDQQGKAAETDALSDPLIYNNFKNAELLQLLK